MSFDLSNVQSIYNAATPKPKAQRVPPSRPPVRRQQVEALYDSGLIPNLHTEHNYSPVDIAAHLNAHLPELGLTPGDKFGASTIRQVMIDKGLIKKRKPRVSNGGGEAPAE